MGNSGIAVIIMHNFEKFINRLLNHEGEYSNDPADPGGETKWGISKRSYPTLNIAALTREDAKVIYHRDFWMQVHANKLPDGIAWQLLDFAVNSGIQTAIRYFQRAIGVADDGYWGPFSQAASDAMTESDMIMGLIAERMDYQTRLKNWPDHGKGWTRRNAKNLRYGMEDS